MFFLGVSAVYVLVSLAIAGALIMLWDPAIGMPWPSEPGDWLAVLWQQALRPWRPAWLGLAAAWLRR